MSESVLHVGGATPYDVVVGRDLIARLPDLIGKSAQRVAVIHSEALAESVAHHQRSDVCAVPAAGIVAEAMVALVLAEAVLEKFGGDSVHETRRNARSYLDTLRYS